MLSSSVKARSMAEEQRKRVFEPFFTTKRAGEGTGLGLPMVYKIIDDYGGSIELDSKRGAGTRVIVRLPLAAPPLMQRAIS